MYPPVRRTRVYVLLTGRLCRTEVAADESAQNLMSGVLHDTAVQGVCLVSWSRVSLPSVVEVGDAIVLLGYAFEVAITPHHAEVP